MSNCWRGRSRLLLMALVMLWYVFLRLVLMLEAPYDTRVQALNMVDA